MACFGVPCRQGLCYCRGPGAEQFPVFPGQRLLLQFYACVVTVTARMDTQKDGETFRDT